VNGWYGPGWFGAGWYWDPWFGAYTFIPASGFFYSPFGWGFYSPLWVYRAPGFYYGHFYRTFGPAWAAGPHYGQWGHGGPGFRGGPPVARWGGPAEAGFHGGGWGGGGFHGGGGFAGGGHAWR
jgi:hypothetical protein